MSLASQNPSALGLSQAPLMLVAPSDVLRRAADTGRYGWTLGAILLLITLIGWVTVQTGLVDRQVDRQTGLALKTLEREQIDLLSRTELADRMQTVREAGQFMKLIHRGTAIVAAPIVLVASLMLIAAVLFAVVALAGQKADYSTLMAICTYAAVVDLLAAGLRLAMMIAYRTIHVDTSLALVVPLTENTRIIKAALTGIDPFAAWFWLLLGLGLMVSGQLSRRAATVTCVSFFVVGCLVRSGAAIAAVLST
ncbi:MAG: YIP1 family protein [Phycisphaerae bacterium]